MPLIIVISAIFVIFCIGSFAYFKSYINKRTSSDAVLADIRDEINRLLVRLDETTNRDVSIIEDKEENLKILLAVVDKKLKLYAREMDRSVTNEKLYRELGASRRFIGETAVQTENTPELSSAPVPEPAPQREPANPGSLGDQIRKLGRSGLSPAIIASKLGISVSEAELALSVSRINRA